MPIKKIMEPRSRRKVAHSVKSVVSTGAGGTASHSVVECLRMSPEVFHIAGTDVNRYQIQLNDLDARYLIPACTEPGYIEALNQVIRAEEAGYVHPQADPEVLKIAKERARVNAKTFLPKVEVIEISQDKYATNQKLASEKVPVASSELLDDGEYKAHWKLKRLLRWNDRAWLRAIHGAGSKAAVPVYNTREMVGHVKLWSHRGLDWKDFMLSEYLPGNDFAFTSLWFDGELVTSVVRRRIMYLLGFTSPSGQSSTPSVAVTVHDERVNRIATEAILALDRKPHGAYYLDLKESKKGVPFVTEANVGRFNATINYFAHAGVNMPYWLVKLAFGEEDDVFAARLPRYNAAPKGLYWVRNIDMSYRLMKEEEFKVVDLSRVKAAQTKK